MKKIKNYDLKTMRHSLIIILSKNLNKNSNWYSEDYNKICEAVSRKTRKELIESLERWDAVESLCKSEILFNCKV